MRFYRFSDLIQYIVLVTLVLSNTGLLINFLFVSEISKPLFYIWAVANLFLIYPFFVYIKTLSKIAKVLDIMIYAMKTTLPFLYLIVVSYSIFTLIGVNIFGGDMGSRTPDLYLQATGGALNANYEKMNFNDFLNSMCFCWTLNLTAMIPILVNMSTLMEIESEGKTQVVARNSRGWFFIIFFIYNNSILFNIFIGQLIGKYLYNNNLKGFAWNTAKVCSRNT